MAFNWIYRLKPEGSPYEIHFRGVTDPDIDQSVLQERQEKERKSMEVLATLTRRLTTMRDFHRWLFTEHDAYNAAGKAFGERRDPGNALQSY